MMATPYLLSTEAAAYLRLKNRAGLYYLITEHKLPFCRRGGLYLFDTRELDAWVHGHASAIEQARTQRSSQRSANAGDQLRAVGGR